jgi:hypothetical protein
MCVPVLIHTHTNTAHCSSYSELPRCGADMAVSSHTTLTQVQLRMPCSPAAAVNLPANLSGCILFTPLLLLALTPKGPDMAVSSRTSLTLVLRTAVFSCCCCYFACRIGAAASWYQTDAACDDSQAAVLRSCPCLLHCCCCCCFSRSRPRCRCC